MCAAQFVALGERVGIGVGGRRRVLRRLAVAEHDAGVLRPEIGGIVAAAAAAAGRDDDVAGQRAIVRRERLGHDRADDRVVGRRRVFAGRWSSDTRPCRDRPRRY